MSNLREKVCHGESDKPFSSENQKDMATQSDKKTSFLPWGVAGSSALCEVPQTACRLSEPFSLTMSKKE